MKLAILLLLWFAPPARAAPTPLHVTAKIVELPKQIILCGRFAYKAVLRYEVISVDKGSYDKKQIFVVELCPEFRKVGEQRKLSLRRVTRDDSFADEFKATAGPRWVHVE